MVRAGAQRNTRLSRPIQPFKLARGYDMIQRLIYDPQVSEAIVEHARRENVPENVAFEQARRYAREIVPSFSATVYFSIGARLARWLSKALYRISIGNFDQARLDRIDPEAAVVFVMNHRSNMDYVLVTYLVAPASALSYAVGEWARVWPLSWMIRAMGAFFIRRKDRGRLYRKVLARYVQMATAGGVTQAFFPEGGLSLDGRLQPARMGILSYIIEGYRPGGRDVIFVPVALNYDRVLEDRLLIAADKSGARRFRPPRGTISRALRAHLWQRLTGRFTTFGTAKVSFGAPMSLAAMMAEGKADVESVAREVMSRVAAVVPAVPVPLVARHLVDGGVVSRAALETRVASDIAMLDVHGVTRPDRSAEEMVADAIDLLLDRAVIGERSDGLTVVPGEEPLLAFYAASLDHLFKGEAPQLPAAAE
ncbi:MAG: 1-acyl-sn-glycerol-3-phosphate acyltransferase [Rubellimicrobium sp.]|nr:1-acyl-sn-glycerol-3-phosphate acyltransferase [Rubellimicrobium sp.]